MSLTCRQERLLRRTGDALARSDPWLASMLADFGQLTAGEQMPEREHLHSPVSRAPRWLRWIVTAWGAAACGLYTQPSSAADGTPVASPPAAWGAQPDHPDLSQP